MHTIRARLEPGEPATNPLVLATIAVEQGLPLRRGELSHRHIGGDAMPAAERHEHATLVRSTRATPGFDGPLRQGLAGIGNDQIQIEINGAPKPLTGFTGSQGAVEGEQIWHRITVGQVALWAMQVLAEFLLLPIREVHTHQSLPETQRLFERIQQAGTTVCLEHEAIHQHLAWRLGSATLSVRREKRSSPLARQRAATGKPQCYWHDCAAQVGRTADSAV